MKAKKKTLLIISRCEIETTLRRNLSLQALREMLRSRVDDFNKKVNKNVTCEIEAIRSKLIFLQALRVTLRSCTAAVRSTKIVEIQGVCKLCVILNGDTQICRLTVKNIG